MPSAMPMRHLEQLADLRLKLDWDANDDGLVVLLRPPGNLCVCAHACTGKGYRVKGIGYRV